MLRTFWSDWFIYFRVGSTAGGGRTVREKEEEEEKKRGERTENSE